MVITVEPMGKLKGNWKLTDRQYVFCSHLLNLYRLHTGHKFDKHLRGWLFFNQETKLHAADFLTFLSAFDICADEHDRVCGGQCPDRDVCLTVYNIISNQSDYSPTKIGDSERSFDQELPVLHGQAAELLRFLDSFNL